MSRLCCQHCFPQEVSRNRAVIACRKFTSFPERAARLYRMTHLVSKPERRRGRLYCLLVVRPLSSALPCAFLDNFRRGRRVRCGDCGSREGANLDQSESGAARAGAGIAAEQTDAVLFHVRTGFRSGARQRSLHQDRRLCARRGHRPLSVIGRSERYLLPVSALLAASMTGMSRFSRQKSWTLSMSCSIRPRSTTVLCCKPL